MERESFIFYKSFFDAIALLEKKDEIADIFLAILGYAFSGKEPDLKGHLKSIFLVVKPQIDANNKRYEFGQLGGRPKKPMVSKSCTNQKPMVFKNCANQKPNDNVNVNVFKEIKKKKKRNLGEYPAKQNPKSPNDQTATDFGEGGKDQTAKDKTANGLKANDLPLREKQNDPSQNSHLLVDIVDNFETSDDNQDVVVVDNPVDNSSHSVEKSKHLTISEIISSTSPSTFLARLEYAKSLGIEDSVANRLCIFAQTHKIALGKVHYSGFVGKSEEESEEMFAMLNFIIEKKEKDGERI